MQVWLCVVASFNAAYALFVLLNIHAGAAVPTPTAIYCVPTYTEPLAPRCARYSPSKHEYFAQNAVCYITHIIIGKSTATNSLATHTHTHVYRARSLAR